MKIYIDPGVNRHAIAEFNRSNYLNNLDFITHEDVDSYVVADDEVLIESPLISGQTRGKDPNDVIALAVEVGVLKGRCLERGAGVRLTPPSDWKGQVKKWIHHSRVWDALNPAERRIAAAAIGMSEAEIEAKIRTACERWAKGDVTKSGQVRGYAWAAHNLLDAVGLGLWDLERLGRGGHRY